MPGVGSLLVNSGGQGGAQNYRTETVEGGGGKNPDNVTQPAIKTVVVPITAVASAAAQSTGVFLPATVYAVRAYLNVITAEVTGITKTVDVGTNSTGDSVLNNASVAATGLVGALNTNVLDGGEEITYTLGSADYAELDAELVLTYEYDENA